MGEAGLRKRHQFVSAKDLAEAFADAPAIDYKQFRADLDAIADPSPWDWDDWQAWADRHVRRDRAEQG